MVDETGLVERLREIHARTIEPHPQPLPEQTSRAAEAMAGVEDQRRRERWQDRIRAANLELAELIPEVADALEALQQEVESLKDHIFGQAEFAEYRIKDGIELGATVWRIALEDIVKENRAALQNGASNGR